ncbi:hypothetical protein BCR35DRAFT_353396 [Leucosporidium creatinivorum]|uniref:G-patch domain-containing protein n=1 Tax=Leucosporidium creatinivorum TaxID=106004 RepID=A0A1Y2EZR9_9BASI|nr:hypothetical protein BCR35DRAFT_353396 [Leucosporidium creatinivorum]
MSASTKFNPGDYLKGLGWKGEGTGLHEGSRAKPVTVAKKTSLSGLGKDRDVAFPWWEMVFKNVAGKVGTSTTDKKDDPHHRTTTGIISPLPPRPKADEYTPSTSSSSGGINMDAFAAAKIEQARRQLYAGFLRGKVVGGTAEEAIKKEQEEAAAAKEEEGAGEEKEGKKRKSNKSEAALEGKRIRKAIRQKRREMRAASKSAATSGASTPAAVEDTEDSEGFVDLGAPSTSTSTSPPPSKPYKRSRSPSTSLPTSSKKSKSSKSKSSRPTPSTTAEHLSPEEHLSLDEAAYKAARKAAKEEEREEKRLRKVVRRALREEQGKAE